MTRDQERFMAFEGLVQWSQAAVAQAGRIKHALEAFRKAIDGSPDDRHLAMLAMHTEYHFFVIASWKVLEYRDWTKTFHLFAEDFFRDFDEFDVSDLKDLRDMREHVVEYFKGDGRRKSRWIKEDSGGTADASSVVGTLIGGRLDWVKFSQAAEKLLDELIRLPIPYPAA